VKQHITVEQLNELSDEAKLKLYEWSKDRLYMNAINFNQELLSIGQMIEFIEGSLFSHNMLDITQNRMADGSCGDSECNCDEYKEWQVAFDFEGELESRSEHLCDALWEACKYILEKE
jgi:hypothetical protein